MGPYTALRNINKKILIQTLTEGAVNSCMAICKWVNVSASSGTSASSSSSAQVLPSTTTEGCRVNESVRRKKGHAIFEVVFASVSSL